MPCNKVIFFTKWINKKPVKWRAQSLTTTIPTFKLSHWKQDLGFEDKKLRVRLEERFL